MDLRKRGHVLCTSGLGSDLHPVAAIGCESLGRRRQEHQAWGREDTWCSAMASLAPPAQEREFGKRPPVTGRSLLAASGVEFATWVGVDTIHSNWMPQEGSCQHSASLLR